MDFSAIKSSLYRRIFIEEKEYQYSAHKNVNMKYGDFVSIKSKNYVGQVTLNFHKKALI